MVRVIFKNLEKSDSVKEVAQERILDVLEKFPLARPRRVVVTLGMENAPTQAGPDVFKVRTEVIGGKYHGLILEKGAVDLYKAVALVREGLLERFNRFSDRARTKQRKERRALALRTRNYDTDW